MIVQLKDIEKYQHQPLYLRHTCLRCGAVLQLSYEDGLYIAQCRRCRFSIEFTQNLRICRPKWATSLVLHGFTTDPPQPDNEFWEGIKQNIYNFIKKNEPVTRTLITLEFWRLLGTDGIEQALHELEQSGHISFRYEGRRQVFYTNREIFNKY